MPPYPTYYPTMNNGFNQPVQNPYQQRMDFLQSYQQTLQQPPQIPQVNQSMQMGIVGKFVPNVEVITANDVPMDGSVAVFPKQDMSEIYVKQWDNNGIIRTIVFKPLLETATNNSPQTDDKKILSLSESITGVFMERFDNLEKQINELMTKSMTRSTTSKPKKEETE